MLQSFKQVVFMNLKKHDVFNTEDTLNYENCVILVLFVTEGWYRYNYNNIEKGRGKRVEFAEIVWENVF